jgi:DegV family protein with EDD domain
MVHIFTDSTSCLSPQAGQRHGIVVLPQTVNFSGKVYREWLNLDPAAFIAQLSAASEIPLSAPASVDEFAVALRPLAESGEPVICLAPSSVVSKTYEIVCQAAKHFRRPISASLIRTFLSPMATLALLAAGWAQAGQSADQIERSLRQMIPCARVFFMVPTLDYLAKSQRVGGAAALVANLLQLKPILTFKNGQVDRFDTARTYRHALIRLQELVLERVTRDSENHITIMHAGDLAQAQALAQRLEMVLELRKIPIYDIPPTVASNAGPGTLGVAFFIEPWA